MYSIYRHWLDLSTHINTSISYPSQKLPNSMKLRGGWLLRRSRSFKVTDFGTNRKLIYDFLLLINSNLPPILHRFQVMVQFSLARGECLTFTLSLGVIPYKYRRKCYITKNLILWPTFLPQKVSVYLQPFYAIRPESYRSRWNYAAGSAITPFKVIQGHRVWYRSKAHMRLPISHLVLFFSFTYTVYMSVCLSVSCVCLWALLPDFK